MVFLLFVYYYLELGGIFNLILDIITYLLFLSQARKERYFPVSCKISGMST